MSTVTKLLKQYGFYLLAILIWLYLRRQDLPYEFEHSADVYFSAFIFLWLVGKYLGNLGKYGSPQFVSNGVHGSCAVLPITVRGWTLFRLGGIDYPPLPKLKGSQASVIVRKETWKKIGSCYVSTARTKPINKYDVPYTLIAYLEKENYPIDNVWLGYGSAELETGDPDFIELEEELNEANSIINITRDAAKGKFEMAEASIKGVERMGKAIRGKKKFRIFHRDSDNDEEE